MSKQARINVSDASCEGLDGAVAVVDLCVWRAYRVPGSGEQADGGGKMLFHYFIFFCLMLPDSQLLR